MPIPYDDDDNDDDVILCESITPLGALPELSDLVSSRHQRPWLQRKPLPLPTQISICTTPIFLAAYLHQTRIVRHHTIPTGLKRRLTPHSTPFTDCTSPILPLSNYSAYSSSSSSQNNTRRRPNVHPLTSNTYSPPTYGEAPDRSPLQHSSLLSTIPRKTIGYCFTLALLLFFVVGIFASSVQAFAFFLLLDDHELPTWRDDDFLQILSGACWQILGITRAMMLTVKQRSEQTDWSQWTAVG